MVGFEIHPTIGIARVGPSTGSFVGPEPGREPPSSYRDADGDLLRQAARFRVFRCERDAGGRLVAASEVTPADGRICWTVHLVNAKGAAPRFPLPDGVPTEQLPLRNAGAPDRTQLVVDPGPRVVEGPGADASLDGGSFLGRPVGLGRIATDQAQALLVTGGMGLSQSVTPDGSAAPLTSFANNDLWCDDVGDGPVTAQLTLAGGEVVDARPAWALVGPPDFAPPVLGFVTLYDLAYQAAVDRGWVTVPAQPSFTRHIQPLLSRAIGYSWVTRYGQVGHASSTLGDFASLWAKLADPQGRRLARQRVLDRLRDPNLAPPASTPVTTMPRLHDETNSDRVLPMTRAQHAMMLSWVQGSFVSDLGSPGPSELLPDLVTRAALESCSGGAFFPGIEAGGLVRDAGLYAEPFRLDPAALRPGGLTQGNAVPWQADFAACEFDDQSEIGWWPSQRPDEVFLDETLSEMGEWADGAETFAEMVAHWHQLGIVQPRVRADGRRVLVEAERVLGRH